MKNDDIQWMQRALDLARRGDGFVEPNPMVGCVLVRNGHVLGKGWHRRYGGAHAEVEALRTAGDAAGATCYVTLEPCSHHGKTPPCTTALLNAGIRRVVVAMRDPNPVVNGRGLDILRRAGLEITEYVLEAEARELNAPYLTRIEKKRPWIVAKWAMTLDGKLASRTGDSQWISGEASRKIVHRLRARMDAILVGSGTAIHDDCLLTVRLDEESEFPKRTPIRIVADTSAKLPLTSKLVRTAKETPLLIAVGPEAPEERLEALRETGCEVFQLLQKQNLTSLLEELAQRGVTRLMVEGGSRLLGDLFDRHWIDEVHAFIAPKLIGGSTALFPLGGTGLADMASAARLESPQIQVVEQDVYVNGRVRYSSPKPQRERKIL